MESNPPNDTGKSEPTVTAPASPAEMTAAQLNWALGFDAYADCPWCTTPVALTDEVRRNAIGGRPMHRICRLEFRLDALEDRLNRLTINAPRF